MHKISSKNGLSLCHKILLQFNTYLKIISTQIWNLNLNPEYEKNYIEKLFPLDIPKRGCILWICEKLYPWIGCIPWISLEWVVSLEVVRSCIPWMGCIFWIEAVSIPQIQEKLSHLIGPQYKKTWPRGYKAWVQAQTQNKAQWLAACRHVHVSASSQSLCFISSLRMNSSFITSRPGFCCNCDQQGYRPACPSPQST